jgi:hypothetical protein
MRTVVASHELLPKGLELESLSVETGCVSISVSPGAEGCFCPVCGRHSSRVHSRWLWQLLVEPRGEGSHVRRRKVGAIAVDEHVANDGRACLL